MLPIKGMQRSQLHTNPHFTYCTLFPCFNPTSHPIEKFLIYLLEYKSMVLGKCDTVKLKLKMMGKYWHYMLAYNTVQRVHWGRKITVHVYLLFNCTA